MDSSSGTRTTYVHLQWDTYSMRLLRESWQLAVGTKYRAVGGGGSFYVQSENAYSIGTISISF